MAAYRPYPPPPSQNPILPHPPPQQQPLQPRLQFSQGWNFNPGGGSAGRGASNANANSGTYRPYNPPPPPPVQNFPYQPPPPPPPESSYVPPPHPPPMMQPSRQPSMPMYYPSSQHQQTYSQYNSTQPSEPPPPPPLPPPSSPPPPPPPQSKEASTSDRNVVVDSSRNSARREHERGKVDGGGNSRRLPDLAGRRENGNVGKMVETEEERRLRKKREYEKQKMLMREKEKPHGVSNSGKGHGHGHGHEHGHESALGSRMGDRRASGTTQLLSSERIENRLKKPTTFLCKMKFRNDLPDPSAQLKYMAFKKDQDRFAKYTITSLEKNWKPELHVEPDLGIPLDLLDLSVYNPPKVRQPLAPEDEELLHDDESVTPVKKDGIRRKERPTDKGVSWLVKTQYISPVSLDSAKQSLTEKQAKELREKKGGLKILDGLNDRERQIKDIEASFMAAKSVPVHATNKNLYPVEVLPLLPDFERYEDPFVVASFDNAPTADSEAYSKLDRLVRDEQEAKAIMKSYVATGADSNKKEQFLAYMVPSADEISKDILDPHEDISYSWVREYNWDVRGDNVDDPSTYLVSFGDSEARYVPLPTKLNLRKKRASEGRSTDEIEQFPAPASITVRQRRTVSAVELKDPEVVGMSSRRGRHALSPKLGHSDDEESLESPRKLARVRDVDQFSREEEEDDYISE